MSRFNLEREPSKASPHLARLMRWVHLVPEPREAPDSLDKEPLKAYFKALPEKDRPVLEAALQAQAQVLLTGDLRHFGPMMGRTDLPLLVLSPSNRHHPKGRANPTRAPPSARFCAQTRPPCQRTTAATRASPRPLPSLA
ncbi:hypothetical protein Mgrana_00906 [Meiothermus granaticius NBRC 107808]|uniref:PIN domain-containing protein n=1 Tax=Meiothermus granaticius NBRC 107808 TaxID=1227551 RepID=A0A399FA50_9DEIN|nr:hypothetical protein Mgrana_00906 [Meiothermus granaticius NBRC 107808]